MRFTINPFALLVVLLVPGFAAFAQNPFTFTTVDQLLPSTMFGSLEWADIDGDNDYDVLQIGNEFDVNLPMLLGYVSHTDEISFREFESGTVIQTVEYSNSELASPHLWFGNSGWLDADNDGDHDLVVVGTTSENEPYLSSTYLLVNDGGSFSTTDLGIQSAISGSVSTGDLDNDGDMDFLVTGISDSGSPSSTVLVNEGGLVFSAAASGIPGFAFGDSDFADFDEDGDLDVLVSGMSDDGRIKTAIYSNEGGLTFSLVDDETIDGLLYGSTEWGDYDQDGDLDILVNGGQLSPTIMKGVFKVYTNNGSGTFSQSIREELGAAQGQAAFGDFDHDGDLDVLVAGGRDVVRARAHGRLYINNNSQVFTHVSNISAPLPSTVAIGDYDGDSDLDLTVNGLSDRGGPITLQYENALRIVNNPPTAPSTNGAQVQGGLVTLSWEASNDVESQSSGLTYALRVGTQPGSSDVMIAAATTSDGYRKFASKGNVGQNTSWTLDLANGTYYWSVQAVDNSYSGSPFSTEGSFAVTESGKGIATGTDDPVGAVPYALNAPFPNPAVDQVRISYTLPEPAFVEVEVFDVVGRKVRRLANHNASVGQSSIDWSLDDDTATNVGSGVYFIRLSSDLGVETRSLVIQ